MLLQVDFPVYLRPVEPGRIDEMLRNDESENLSSVARYTGPIRATAGILQLVLLCAPLSSVAWKGFYLRSSRAGGHRNRTVAPSLKTQTARRGSSSQLIPLVSNPIVGSTAASFRPNSTTATNPRLLSHTNATGYAPCSCQNRKEETRIVRRYPSGAPVPTTRTPTPAHRRPTHRKCSSRDI